jgi:cation:H+ antiporter
MANMAILAGADLALRRGRILTRVAINQTLVGLLAITLVALAAAGLLSGDGSLLGIGWSTLAIAFTYIAGMRMLHRNRPEPPFRTPEAIDAARKRSPPLRRSIAGIALAALVILIAAPFLAQSAADLATQFGLSGGFVGLLLLAITTSLPELAVSAESLRAGTYDLAVGNLLGSNCFNLFVLFVLDAVEGPGSILALSDPALLIGAVFGILLTALALLEIMNKSEKRFWILEPGPAFMLLAYLAGIYLAYAAAR